MKLLHNPPSLIKQVFNSFVWETDNNKILFTFDDGPNPESTEIILNTLQQYKIKGLFFCVGNNVVKYPDLFRGIIEEGHTAGNHTFNHTIIVNKKGSAVEREIDEMNDHVLEKFNYDIRYFRPPHGRFNFRTAGMMKKKNLKNVMWSLLTYDYKNDMDKVKFAVENYMQRNSIIVFHDSNKSKDIIKESIEMTAEAAYSRKFEIGDPSSCLK